MGGDIDGVSNPVLHAEPGDMVTVTLINGEGAEHDLFFPEVNAKTKRLKSQGNSDTITFEVPNRETVLAYYDSVPGHVEAGMLGKLIVGASVEEPVSAVEPTSSVEKPAGLYDKELALAAFQKGGCAACHTIPGVQGAVGTIGPDLTNFGKVAAEMVASAEYTGKATTAEEYIEESIVDPAAFVAPKCPSGPCQAGLMPPTFGQTYTSDELAAVVGYLANLTGDVAVEPAPGGCSGPLR